MIFRCRGQAVVAVSVLVLGSCGWTRAGQSEGADQLTLADLAAYRSALSGKATADGARASDQPVRTTFRDLWSHPDGFRGRRVTVNGRVERIFRQGQVGSFPALAEVWVASPAGDPFCLIVPERDGSGVLPEHTPGTNNLGTRRPIPNIGQTVQFTGTFLKMVRYAAGDGARLAPLVVGAHAPAQDTAQASTDRGQPGVRLKKWAGSPASWLVGLTLALITAVGLAWRSLHRPFERTELHDRRRQIEASPFSDPPLTFIEPSNKRP